MASFGFASIGLRARRAVLIPCAESDGWVFVLCLHYRQGNQSFREAHTFPVSCN